MKLSEDKLTYLADQVTRALRLDKALALGKTPRGEVLRHVTLALRHDAEREAAIEERVTKKISSIKRGVMEGSSEWDALHRQFYIEELDKLQTGKKTW